MVVHSIHQGNGQELKPGTEITDGGTYKWIHVKVDSNKDEIVCTPGHKFYLPDNKQNRSRGEKLEHASYADLSAQWVSAEHLKPGDRVLLVDGNYGIISSVEIEKLEQPETTYNFEVADYHTYYVGEQGVLVHNTCTGVDELDSFDVFEFDQRAVDFAKQGDPAFQTFKNRLFAEQQRLHGSFDEVVRGINPSISGKQIIVHHPLGRAGANLYNVVGVTQQQHLAIHAIIGYKNANWAGVLYNLGSGVF